jgi:hypothetical protein
VIRRRLAAAALMLAATFAADARASPSASGPSVLLIAADDDPIGTRVSAELRALGFDVVEVTRPSAPHGDSEVDLSARSARTVAAIAIGRAGGEVQVWTLTPAGLVLRATIEKDADAAVIALRTVEALRTSVSDLHAQSAAPPPAAPVPAARTEDQVPGAPAGEAPSRWGASLAPAFSVSPGEPEGSWHAMAAVHWVGRARWGVEVVGMIPVSGTRWNESEGSALMTYGLAAAGARWEPFADRPYAGDVGLGIGAIYIHADGSPGPGFVGSTASTAVAAPYARIGYPVALAPWLRLRADLAAFLAVPRPVLTFAGHDEGRWGQPLLSGSIGLEIVSR